MDNSGRSGGLLPYVRSEIPSRLLTKFTKKTKNLLEGQGWILYRSDP